jgi:hypothetical protein
LLLGFTNITEADALDACRQLHRLIGKVVAEPQREHVRGMRRGVHGQDQWE